MLEFFFIVSLFMNVEQPFPSIKKSKSERKKGKKKIKCFSLIVLTILDSFDRWNWFSAFSLPLVNCFS